MIHNLFDIEKLCFPFIGNCYFFIYINFLYFQQFPKQPSTTEFMLKVLFLITMPSSILRI